MKAEWQTVYADEYVQLKRHKPAGVYSLYDAMTKSVMILPELEHESMRRWETLFEDDVMRLRRHKGIEALYVLLNKPSGYLVIIIAHEHEKLPKLLRGTFIPIPGGLEE